jgi:hypothetical protein
MYLTVQTQASTEAYLDTLKFCDHLPLHAANLSAAQEQRSTR